MLGQHPNNFQDCYTTVFLDMQTKRCEWYECIHVFLDTTITVSVYASNKTRQKHMIPWKDSKYNVEVILALEVIIIH